MKTVKVVCISDTHCKLHKVNVPDGDILIHAGDSTFQGSTHEISDFFKALAKLPHKHKVVISGNHDWMFENDLPKAKLLIPADKGIVYLQDTMVELEGLKIYGSPWQPWFCDWAFNVERGSKLKVIWSLIPDDADVVVTHGPPLGIRDLTPRGEAVGCEDLAEAIRRVKPQLHVFGHIHAGYGMSCIDGVTYVNASICTEQYLPTNEPIVVDLEVVESDQENGDTDG